MAKKAVDKAKENWIRRTAKDGEAGWKTRWESIRRLQQVHAGCRPSALRKEDGEITAEVASALQQSAE